MFYNNRKPKKGSIVVWKNNKQTYLVSLISDNGIYAFIDTDLWLSDECIIKWCKTVLVEDLIVMKR